MKRDLELMRSLLIQAEDQPAGELMQRATVPEGVTLATVCEHIRLLEDAGLIEGNVSPRGEYFIISRVTNSGHDFLADARNEGVWTNARKWVNEKGGEVALDLFKEVLKHYAKQAMMLGLGG